MSTTETRPGTPTRPGTSGGLSSTRKTLGELAALRGVVRFPVRIKCATLSWNTLVQGLDEVEAGVIEAGVEPTE